MKLRLFSVALLQAIGFYSMSEAVPIHSLIETDNEAIAKADTKVAAEAEAESAIDAVADVDAAAAAKLKAVSQIKNQITSQVESQIAAAMKLNAEAEALAIAEGDEGCGGDQRFDFLAGPSKLELKDFTLEGIDPAVLDQPISFEINAEVPMTLNLPPKM